MLWETALPVVASILVVVLQALLALRRGLLKGGNLSGFFTNTGVQLRGRQSHFHVAYYFCCVSDVGRVNMSQMPQVIMCHAISYLFTKPLKAQALRVDLSVNFIAEHEHNDGVLSMKSGTCRNLATMRAERGRLPLSPALKMSDLQLNTTTHETVHSLQRLLSFQLHVSCALFCLPCSL